MLYGDDFEHLVMTTLCPDAQALWVEVGEEEQCLPSEVRPRCELNAGTMTLNRRLDGLN